MAVLPTRLIVGGVIVALIVGGTVIYRAWQGWRFRDRYGFSMRRARDGGTDSLEIWD